MSRSRMVWVLKRGGAAEAFDRNKLRACMLRLIRPPDEGLYLADALSAAIESYLRRRGQRCVSSRALLEMTVSALRTVKMPESAEELEEAHARRLRLRRQLSVEHEAGSRTAWSKDWLAQQACTQWSLGRATGRILAGKVERRLMRLGSDCVRRDEVMALLGNLAAAYGLAEVPGVAARPG